MNGLIIMVVVTLILFGVVGIVAEIYRTPLDVNREEDEDAT